MRFYQAESYVPAPPAQVWPVLADVSAYPTWDSGVLEVKGRLAVGEKLRLVSAVNPGRAFPLSVAEIEPPHRMVWTGGMPLGLFRGTRTFTLTPEGSGSRFRLREEFTGPMLPLIWRSMPDLTASMQQFADGLAARFR